MITVDEGNIVKRTVIMCTCILCSLSIDGQALLVNLHRDVILHHFNFKSRVYDIKFSPNGR